MFFLIISDNNLLDNIYRYPYLYIYIYSYTYIYSFHAYVKAVSSRAAPCHASAWLAFSSGRTACHQRRKRFGAKHSLCTWKAWVLRFRGVFSLARSSSVSETQTTQVWCLCFACSRHKRTSMWRPRSCLPYLTRNGSAQSSTRLFMKQRSFETILHGSIAGLRKKTATYSARLAAQMQHVQVGISSALRRLLEL